MSSRAPSSTWLKLIHRSSSIHAARWWSYHIISYHIEWQHLLTTKHEKLVSCSIITRSQSATDATYQNLVLFKCILTEKFPSFQQLLRFLNLYHPAYEAIQCTLPIRRNLSNTADANVFMLIPCSALIDVICGVPQGSVLGGEWVVS